MVQPPPPTADRPLKPGEDPAHRRGAFVPMLVGLLAIVGVAMYVVWEDMTPSQIQHQVTGQMANMSYDPMGVESSTLNATLRGIAAGPAISDLLTISSADKSLLTEPAGLDAPESGQRIAGLTRADGTIGEEFAIWELSDLPQVVLDWYTQRAVEKGFRPLEAWDNAHSASGATSRVFVKSAGRAGGRDGVPADQVLIVRARSLEDQGTRVLVWHRHPVRGRR